MTRDLFENDGNKPWAERLSAGTVLLHHFASADAADLLAAVHGVLQQAPLRQMFTPGGLPMSVASSSCGDVGWVSDHHGYRYESCDPASGKPWPAMPASLRKLAETAASAAGFTAFQPDACLINRYLAGTKMSLHQDKDERDFTQPIVSVSLGLPAVFLLGGWQRSDKAMRLPLQHGDVLVWGGADRLRFHGVMPIVAGQHELAGNCRINLTFRKAK